MLALVQLALGVSLGRLHLRPRELGQLGDRGLKCVRTERLERGRQPLLGVVDRGQALLPPSPLVLQIRPGADQFAFQLARVIGGNGQTTQARQQHGGDQRRPDEQTKQ